MIENKTCKIKKRCLDENIGFFDFVEINGYIWIAAINYNALFRVDLQTMIPQYVGSFPGESMYQAWLYRSVVRVGNRLIFAPFMAESIGEYDLEKECFIEHEKLKDSGIKFKFESMVCRGEEVFFFPQRYSYMVVYQTAKHRITYDKCLKDALEQKGQAGGAIFWGVGATEGEKHIYIPKRGATDIVRYDFGGRHAEKLVIEQESPLLICSLIDGWLWLLPAENMPLAKWNVETGEKVIYNELVVECEDAGAPFIRAVDCGEKICFVREFSKETLLYDKASDTFEGVGVSYQPGKDLVEKPWKGNYYFAEKLGKNQILTVSKKNHGVIVFDINSKQLQSFRLRMSDVDRKKWSTNALFRDFNRQTKTLFENTEDSLECFMDFLQQENKEDAESDKQ